MSEKKLLPVGSVVSIENVEHRFIIVGHMRRQAEGGKLWDYAALPFPEGVVDAGKFFMFNNGQIRLIHMIGIQDKESIDYMTKLMQVINADPEKFKTEE